jgi:hypothetical protein
MGFWSKVKSVFSKSKEPVQSPKKIAKQEVKLEKKIEKLSLELIEIEQNYPKLDEIKTEYMKSGYRKSPEQLFTIFERYIQLPILTWIPKARKTYGDNNIFKIQLDNFKYNYSLELKKQFNLPRSKFNLDFDSKIKFPIKKDIIGFRDFVKGINTSSKFERKDLDIESLLISLNNFNREFLKLKISIKNNLDGIDLLNLTNKNFKPNHMLKDYNAKIFFPLLKFIRKFKKLILKNQDFFYNASPQYFSQLISGKLEKKFISFYPNSLISVFDQKKSNKKTLILIGTEVNKPILFEIDQINKFILNSIKISRKQPSKLPKLPQRIKAA